MNSLSFAQMLCSRLCHDLITPIGAVNTGMELLTDCSEADRSQLLAISKQSAETASRRLVYYRAAFGFSAATHIASFETLNTFITGFLNPIKINLQWQEKPEDFEGIKKDIESAAFVRIVLNLVLLAAETAPFGGMMSLSMQMAAESWSLTLKVTDNLVEIRPEVKQALQGQLEEEQYSPHTVQAIMTQMLMRENEVQLDELSSSKAELLIRIKKNIDCYNLTAMLF